MIISVNFQMTELKHGAQPISMGVAVKPKFDSPIHVFYAEFSDADYMKVSHNQLSWLNENVTNKLMATTHITEEGMDEVADILSSDKVKTTFRYGDTATIGEYLRGWLRYIRRGYDMMNDEIEFLSDIPAYDKVMMTKILNMDGCQLMETQHVKILPYDICLNAVIANKYKISMRDAYELNRYELLSDESHSIYLELSPEGRTVTHAFYNCLESLLLYNDIQSK